MRGSAIDSRRSRNSHIRSPRNVTLAPIGMPSRSLNCAMDLRARCTSGFWPVIAVRSRTAPSISFASRAASPTPMLTTTFTTPGICMTLSYENCSRSPGAISSAYRCLSRGTGWVGAVIFRSSAGPDLVPRSEQASSLPARAAGARARSSDVLTGPERDPDPAPVLVPAEADAGRPVVRVDHHHVAHVDGGLLRDDAAGLRTPRGRRDPGVLLDPVDALDQDPLLLRVSRDDLALGAAVRAGDDLDGVALLDLHGRPGHHNTSGASEMIFMKRLSRSSRPTGPKMRVRRRSLAVRTTTARTTSPFLTPAPGSASLTVATMMSPIPAYRRPEPPSTRMQRISFAPVLSATRKRDSCWITRSSGASLGLLQDLHDPPPLGGRQRARLHHQHPVTDAAGVLLVVHLELAGAPDDLAVERVLDPVLDLDHRGLVHLVGHHEALADLAAAAHDGVVRRRTRLLAHLPLLIQSRPRPSVGTGLVAPRSPCGRSLSLTPHPRPGRRTGRARARA